MDQRPYDPLPERNALDELQPSSTGLDPTLAAALAYVLLFASGIALLLIERRSEFVRFHAMQSTLAFLGLTVLSVAVGWVPLLGQVAGFVLWLGGLVAWLGCMVKALQGEWFKLPIVGDMAEERAQRRD